MEKCIQFWKKFSFNNHEASYIHKTSAIPDFCVFIRKAKTGRLCISNQLLRNILIENLMVEVEAVVMNMEFEYSFSGNFGLSAFRRKEPDPTIDELLTIYN